MAALDYSNDPLKPTLLELSPSTSGYEITVINSVGDSDKADYIYFDIPSNHELADIILTAYKSSDNKAFVALQKGKAITANEQNPSTLIGYTHFGPLKPEEAKGKSILDLLGGKKPAESYSLWIQQLGTLTDYSFKIKLNTGTAHDKYYSALTSGNASQVSKKIDWKELDISTATSDFYQAVDWKSVNMSLLQKFQNSGIDWGKVQYQEFSVAQYTQTNWSLVNTSQLSDANYDSIDWGRVAYKGSKSINYSQLSWSKVDFGDFSVATYKQVDWSQVKTADLTEQQYSEINWGQVSFKGTKAPSLSNLDLSLVVGSSTFSKKTAKQIDWTQVSSDDLSASALSKLSGLGVKKKGVNVAELLKPGTQSKELSFAGVGQAQAGALTTGLEDSGSGAQVLLAAVEKQPVLV